MGEATARSADLLERAIGPTRPPSAWQSLPKVVESKTGWLNDQREAAGACQVMNGAPNLAAIHNWRVFVTASRTTSAVSGLRATGQVT